MSQSLKFVSLQVNVERPGYSQGFGTDDEAGAHDPYNLVQDGRREVVVLQLLSKLADAIASNQSSIQVEVDGGSIVPDLKPPACAASVVASSADKTMAKSGPALKTKKAATTNLVALVRRARPAASREKKE